VLVLALVLVPPLPVEGGGGEMRWFLLYSASAICWQYATAPRVVGTFGPTALLKMQQETCG